MYLSSKYSLMLINILTLYFDLVQLNVFLLYCHFVKWSLSLLITCSKYIHGYEKKKNQTLFQNHNFK